MEESNPTNPVQPTIEKKIVAENTSADKPLDSKPVVASKSVVRRTPLAKTVVPVVALKPKAGDHA